MPTLVGDGERLGEQIGCHFSVANTNVEVGE
jgi:hypothetical protein